MPLRTVHLVGAGGQLGTALIARAPAGTELIAYSSSLLDVTDAGSVRTALAGLVPGDVVLNAAAYTDVDGAQTDREVAFAVNADGPGHLAAATAAAGARLIHVSTDYVFAPEPGRTAALEPGDLDPDAAPATVYGASKLAGERSALAADPSSTVVRTAWVYTGGPESADFVGTMRRLEASRPEISVVDDQRGCPTYVADLADGLWELTAQTATEPERTAGAVLHAAGGGEATWYRLARAVFAGVGADPDRVRPCTTADFPRPAPRPTFSVLSGRSWAEAGLTPLRDWPAALRDALDPPA
ncbi:dTDP-4-dehydrorhamnose reductase [Gordonia caeni]|uniref:dTDP-4-dehydrorhamnose reductase n=1 Tax=Gordonia caeni TaxID=1007097 RepID=A0ABP7PA36_9ACTN